MASRFIPSLAEADRQALAHASSVRSEACLASPRSCDPLEQSRYTIAQVSDILEVGRNTLTIWFQKWEASGLDLKSSSINLVVAVIRSLMTAIESGCRLWLRSTLISYALCRPSYRRKQEKPSARTPYAGH